MKENICLRLMGLWLWLLLAPRNAVDHIVTVLTKRMFVPPDEVVR